MEWMIISDRYAKFNFSYDKMWNITWKDRATARRTSPQCFFFFGMDQDNHCACKEWPMDDAKFCEKG